ncbi:hypothetical protein ACI5KX_00850 [Erythrobacter sp. GH1-10]|uniref:hypothetical protein n=1 Tax=Erythrobacter sp. GH1-10 TaxID=3349334 RepID=UPI003877BC12
MAVFRSHWVWFFAVLTVVSGFDYWDHISRPGSPFSEAPGAWFAFTLACHSSLCAVAYGLAAALKRLPIQPLIADTAGVGGAVAFHLLLTGPLWDGIFWTGDLHFNAGIVPMLAACFLYLLYRLAFGFFAHLLGNHPKSLP